MQGQRIQYDNESPMPSPGDYWKDEHGKWHGVAPNGLVANLAGHEVTEHDDGTITVTPSIKVSLVHAGLIWHGYLTSGIWNEF